MKNSIRRTVASIIAIAAVCTPLTSAPAQKELSVKPISVSAAESSNVIRSGNCNRGNWHCSDEFENYTLNYQITSRGSITVGCETTRPGTTIRVPKTLGGKKVISVADNAFKGQTNIIDVLFYGTNDIYITDHPYGPPIAAKGLDGGSQIAEIGESAFEGCTNLTRVSFGEKEVTIKKAAFRGCENLNRLSFVDAKNYTLKLMLGDIGPNAFENTGFVYMDNYEFKNIGDSAFASCKKLRRVSATADTIGNNAFKGCNRITEIDITANSIGDECFTECSILRDVKVKANSIGGYCFEKDTAIKTVSLDVPVVGRNSFSGCSNLERVTLQNTQRIESHAFVGCPNMELSDFPKTIEYIGPFAFWGDTNLSTPALFVRDNGQKLQIGRASFCNTSVGYVVLCGDIDVDDYAFDDCSLKAAVVEGNVTISRDGLGTVKHNDPKFAVYGTSDTNPYTNVTYNNVPYVKYDNTDGYTKIINEYKKHYLPIIGNGFSNSNGSCAGISIAQNMIISGKLDYSDILPEGYSCFMDLPHRVKGVAGFEDFVAKIDELHSNWTYFPYKNHKVELTSDNIEGYAKLTKYGIAIPGSMRIDNHRHAITFLGIEKLDETKVIDSYTESGMACDYRIITMENGYSFKYDQNGDLVGNGFDVNTLGDKWIPVEDTFIYIRSSDGRCYAQRWDHPDNVKHEKEKNANYNYSVMSFSDLQLVTGNWIYNHTI